MSDYTKSTNFASKDSLASGNPLKIVKGAEIDTEFNNIATAVATKADKIGPTFSGTTSLENITVSGTASITGAATVNGTLTLNNVLVFEGSTADAYETTLQVTDPTADRTITLPDKSGTVAFTSDISTTSITSKTGTYSASGSSTVTLSVNSHGLSAGDYIFLDFTSGTATDNNFTVASVVDANSYTVNYGSTGTFSGNVTQYYSPLGQVRIASPTEAIAGTETNKAVSPAALGAALVSYGLGVGQTWQNVTSSRSASTTYTNNTGKPIQVNIHYAQFVDSTWDMQLTVGGVVVARDAGGRSGSGNNGGGTCSAIVPNGSTYSFTGSYNVWAELR